LRTTDIIGFSQNHIRLSSTKPDVDDVYFNYYISQQHCSSEIRLNLNNLIFIRKTPQKPLFLRN
jgi:hypothetical protein